MGGRKVWWGGLEWGTEITSECWVYALHICGTESSVSSLRQLTLSREAHSMTTQGRIAMLGRPKCLIA